MITLSVRQRLDRAREALESAKRELARDEQGRERTYMVLRARKYLNVVYKMCTEHYMRRHGATPEEWGEREQIVAEADDIWPAAKS